MNRALTRTSPRGIFPQDFDELLGRFWNDAPSEWVPNGIAAPMDISESDNAFEIRLDVPAMKAEDFDIQVQGNIVTISGKREEEKEEKGKTFHRVERRCGSFSRSVTLSCNVNEGEVAAQYADGVLSVTLPKAEDQRPKKIAVKT